MGYAKVIHEKEEEKERKKGLRKNGQVSEI
jgi:hypothetical protein